MGGGQACDRCGAPLVPSGRGRPRRWCSDTCRMAAWGERHSPTPTAPIGPDQAVEVVLTSPTALREVLVALTARIDADTLDDNGVIDALAGAHDALVRAVMRGATSRCGRG